MSDSIISQYLLHQILKSVLTDKLQGVQSNNFSFGGGTFSDAMSESKINNTLTQLDRE